jgi:hypothetical protein
MEMRTLGETGLEVSRVGFGGAPLGLQDYLDREDKSSEEFESQAVAAIRLAVDRGINLFDTAPGYGDGRSEEIVGRALAGRRDDVLVATKFHQWRDGSAGAARSTFERSLQNLRTDHVDLLQVHGGYFTDEAARELLASEVLGWARSEKERGRARCLGITAETASCGLERLLRSGVFDTLQVAYSFIYQSHCDYQRGPKGIIPFARDLGVGILTMRTATSGFLQRVMKMEFPELSAAELTAFSIRFVLSTPDVDCALIGMKNEDEVRMNVELAEDRSNRLDLVALNDRYGIDLDELE